MLMSILKSILKIVDGILASKDSELRHRVEKLRAWIVSIVDDDKFKSNKK